MEMTLYEFILGLVGTFFVFIPALAALIHILFKELKKSDERSKEEKFFHESVLSCLQTIARNIWFVACSKDIDDEEEE